MKKKKLIHINKSKKISLYTAMECTPAQNKTIHNTDTSLSNRTHIHKREKHSAILSKRGMSGNDDKDKTIMGVIEKHRHTYTIETTNKKDRNDYIVSKESVEYLSLIHI